MVAVITHACVACAVATGGSFNSLALVSGGAFCFVYIGCAAAAWQLQRLGFSQTEGGDQVAVADVYAGDAGSQWLASPTCSRAWR